MVSPTPAPALLPLSPDLPQSPCPQVRLPFLHPVHSPSMLRALLQGQKATRCKLLPLRASATLQSLLSPLSGPRISLRTLARPALPLAVRRRLPLPSKTPIPPQSFPALVSPIRCPPAS